MKSKIFNTFFTKWFTSYYFTKEKFESKSTSIPKVQIYHISNEIHIFYHTCLVDQFMELLRAKDRWNRSQSFICHRESIGTYKCSGIHNCQKAKLGFTAIHGADDDDGAGGRCGKKPLHWQQKFTCSYFRIMLLIPLCWYTYQH